MRRFRLVRAIGAVAVAATPGLATAEPWLTAEVPAVFPVSRPHVEVFGGGALPAVGLYLPASPHLALAVRARAGVLSDGAPPMNGLADPAWGGLGTLSFAVRASGGRTWLEVAAGGGITGTDLVPSLELGAGWATPVGSFELGPSMRYVQLGAGTGPGLGLGAAGLVLVGIEVRGARSSRSRREPGRREPASVEPTVARDRDRLIDRAPGCAEDESDCLPVYRDHDTVVEVLESCSVLAGMIDGAMAGEGCTAGGPIEVESDRIILAEQVLFRVRRARIRRAARPVLHAIAAAWKRGEWERLTVEGHADLRGAPESNRWLSQLRAERARAVLVDAGVPAAAIDAIGYGSSRPRSSDDHEVNRRVEFVIRPRQVAGAVIP